MRKDVPCVMPRLLKYFCIVLKVLLVLFCAVVIGFAAQVTYRLHAAKVHQHNAAMKALKDDPRPHVE